jgi:hypothetical protein
VSARRRQIKGVGKQVDPLDGDKVIIEVGVRDGKIVTIGVDGLRTGLVTSASGVSQSIWFRTGAEARTLGGETFAGCETARRAALVLHKVFIGREIAEAMAISASDVIAKMPGECPESEGCVPTVIEAVRRALIDVQIRALAEAVVEVRSLR